MVISGLRQEETGTVCKYILGSDTGQEEKAGDDPHSYTLGEVHSYFQAAAHPVGRHTHCVNVTVV